MAKTELIPFLIGVIDLGTNTFNLVIAEIQHDNYRVIHKKKISVKLGEGGISKDFIAPIPFQRGLDALRIYKGILRSMSVDCFYAVATSAIRSAHNGSEFVEKVKSELQININVIDGDTEADLIYRGVRQAIDLGEKPKLIIDIGGGSTEFIIANRQEDFWRKSYQIGAARILEIFLPNDPITIEDVNDIDTHLFDTLEEMIQMCEAYEIDSIVGSSGSFDTLAEMISFNKVSRTSWDKESFYAFDFDDYSEVQRLIYSSTLQERLKMKGLDPMRADMIVVSIIIINFLLNRLPLNHMYLSSYALKEGLIKSLINNSDGWRKSLL